MAEKLKFILTRRCDQDGKKVIALGEKRTQRLFWIKGRKGCRECSTKGCLAQGILFEVNGRKII